MKAQWYSLVHVYIGLMNMFCYITKVYFDNWLKAGQALFSRDLQILSSKQECVPIIIYCVHEHLLLL